jgi:hypothetical protein
MIKYDTEDGSALSKNTFHLKAQIVSIFFSSFQTTYRTQLEQIKTSFADPDPSFVRNPDPDPC